MGGLRLVTANRALVGPAAFLLTVTVAVVLLHGGGHAPPAPKRPAIPVRHAPVHLGPRAYTVGAGDTLAGIAGKTGVPLAKLQALNPNLHPSLLFIGEKIRLR